MFVVAAVEMGIYLLEFRRERTLAGRAATSQNQRLRCRDGRNPPWTLEMTRAAARRPVPGTFPLGGLPPTLTPERRTGARRSITLAHREAITPSKQTRPSRSLAERRNSPSGQTPLEG
jgi:hypothetical protein